SVGVVVEGTGCVVTDVGVRGGDTALLLSGSQQGTFERITVEGGRVGIDASMASGNVFREIVSRGDAEIGIRLRKARANEIRGAAIEGAATGLSLEDSEDNLLVEVDIRGASIVGCEVLGGRGNTLTASRIRTSRAGVVLEGTVENGIADCVVQTVEDVGVSLIDARRNRMERNAVDVCGTDGVRITGGGENGFVDSRVSRCQGAGVRADGSDDNLIARNVVSKSPIGIFLARSAGARLLGNTVAETNIAGILLEGARRNELVDNRVDRAPSGIVLIGAEENSVLRSDLRRCGGIGVVLANRCQANIVTESAISGAATGVLITSSSRDAVQANRIFACGVGVIIHAPGFGVRVVGNRLERNNVGLRWASTLSPTDAVLAALGIVPAAEPTGGTPIVQDNFFAGSRRADVENETHELLYAGGNRWDDEPTVSPNVHLPDTAWKGTVVVASGRNLTDLVLSCTLEVALSEAGFRVVDLSGLGEPNALLDAMAQGDVDLVWWFGDAVSLLAAPSETMVFWSTPARLRWDWIVSSDVAHALSEPSISAFLRHRALGDEAIAIPDALSDGAVSQLALSYGLHARQFRRVATREEVEVLLKFGTVSAAVLENLEETATVAGFVRLEDDASALPDRGVGVLVREGSLGRLPGIESVFAKLSPHLTEENLRSMVSRVRLFRREPLDVVTEFLSHEGLID
ncbi:MAG: NosD domain-containing protein, partial [Candidatus Bipolaricaulis sp.]|nr:NosD domain-containing protein [Candidatus Bipolaricaulis sp.]